MKIRCVVTGHNPSGRSAITKDAAVEPVTLSLLPTAGVRVSSDLGRRRCSEAAS